MTQVAIVRRTRDGKWLLIVETQGRPELDVATLYDDLPDAVINLAQQIAAGPTLLSAAVQIQREDAS